MRIMHGVLHGNKWIMFHGLATVMLGPSKRGGFDAKIGTVIIDIGS